MTPKQLATTLAKTIAAKLPVLIKGPPGVGKTAIVEQAAEEAGANLIVMHPVVSDPTDFKGMPAITAKGTAEFLPFGDLKALMTAKAPTVCLMDDVGQAPAAVQAALMQLILARQINGKAISDHVVFVAATNRREDKAGVSGLLEPVKSRFATIVDLEPNVNHWCEWALENRVPPEVVAFVRFRPELMTAPGAPTNDIVNRPSPRTVTNMSKLYAIGFDDLETLGGAVGAAFAAEFVGFIKVWKDLPSVDSILVSPESAKLPQTPAGRFAIATALATVATAENMGRVIKYAVRLPEEFSVLCVRDALRKSPAAANCADFIKWANKNQALLSGE